MDFKDYYNTLGISPQADAKAIQKAFRALARKVHPDVNPGNKDAEEKFKTINGPTRCSQMWNSARSMTSCGRNTSNGSKPGRRPTGFRLAKLVSLLKQEDLPSKARVSNMPMQKT